MIQDDDPLPKRPKAKASEAAQKKMIAKEKNQRCYYKRHWKSWVLEMQRKREREGN